MRSKRELGLLYRIREMHVASRVLYRSLKDIADGPLSVRIPPAELFAVKTILNSCARTLAIEEGKQNADYENFGILLENLDNRKVDRRKTWRKKTSQPLVCSQKGEIEHSLSLPKPEE